MTTTLISIQLKFKPNFQIRFLFRNGGRTFYPPIILIELRLDNDYSISYLKTWHGHFCSWCMFKKVPELSYKVQVKARSGKVDLHFQWLWFWSSRFKFRFIFFIYWQIQFHLHDGVWNWVIDHFEKGHLIRMYFYTFFCLGPQKKELLHIIINFKRTQTSRYIFMQDWP